MHRPNALSFDLDQSPLGLPHILAALPLRFWDIERGVMSASDGQPSFRLCGLPSMPARSAEGGTCGMPRPKTA